MIFHNYPAVYFRRNIRIIFPLVKENSDRIFLSLQGLLAVLSYQGLLAITEIREDDNKGPREQGKSAA